MHCFEIYFKDGRVYYFEDSKFYVSSNRLIVSCSSFFECYNLYEVKKIIFK